MTSPDLLSTLTPEQLAAVTAEGAWIHVSAGPGSGKTRTIAARVAHLIDQGEDPHEICVLTFTRASCAEILARVHGQVGPVASGVRIETFHGRALLDGPPMGGLEVATEAHVDAAIESLYSGPMRRPRRELPGKTALRREIMQWAASGEDCGETLNLLACRLEDAGLIPTWMLIHRWRCAWCDGDASEYRHVLVDESQDATPSEIAMARDLRSEDGFLYVVGDMRQAIMGWRGAAPEQWGATTHHLARTFRFGVGISDEANGLEVGPPIIGDVTMQSFVRRASFADLDLLFERSAETAILCRTHRDCDAMQRLYPDKVRHVQRDNLDPLSSAADRLAAATVNGFIPVTTVHGFKGREADRIIVIGPSTISWGRTAKAEEERRVLFVAETRARRELVLVTGEAPSVEGWTPRHDGVREVAS